MSETPSKPAEPDREATVQSPLHESGHESGHEPEPERGSEVTISAEPTLAGALLKDVVIVLAAMSLWAAADTWYTVTGLWLAAGVAIADALAVGVLLGVLFHEWGHYAGAVLSGGQVTRKHTTGYSPLRFNFDYDANDHRQFHWMTGGGHLFHWAILLVLLVALPLDTLSRIALVSATFGFIVFATLIEFGIVRDTWAGADPAARLAELKPEDFRRATLIGALGSLFAITALA